MNILITGIHGFVGSNLVVSLREEHTLYGLDIVAPEREGVVRTYSWEDLEQRRLPKVDAIIHLAGKAHDTKNQAAAQVYFDINTGLTKKVFDYFLESDVRKFIFFSSVKAAADSVPGEVLTEDIVPAPVGPYGESKIAAENYILGNEESSMRNEALREKRVYILRPCMIHGPGNKGNLNLLYGVVRRGIPWPLGAFENRRSFTSVDNLCHVIGKMLVGSELGIRGKDPGTGEEPVYQVGIESDFGICSDPAEKRTDFQFVVKILQEKISDIPLSAGRNEGT